MSLAIQELKQQVDLFKRFVREGAGKRNYYLLGEEKAIIEGHRGNSFIVGFSPESDLPIAPPSITPWGSEQNVARYVTLSEKGPVLQEPRREKLFRWGSFTIQHTPRGNSYSANTTIYRLPNAAPAEITRKTTGQWTSYSEYLGSSTWQEKRQEVRERSGGFCEVCSVSGIYRVAIDTHHIRYPKQLGTEPTTDLLHVCREHHEQLHGNVA